MYKAIGKNCLLYSYLSKKFGVFCRFFQKFGPFLLLFVFFLCNTWLGQMMVLSTFQRPAV